MVMRSLHSLRRVIGSSRSRRGYVSLGAVMICFALGAVGWGVAAWRSTAQPSMEEEARIAARRFLDRHLASDGRVIRHDQGGDTVSEGQAYALLSAVAVGDLARFDMAWSWAKRHLQRSDGLLSWRWHEGKVVDRGAAPDADVDAAHALLLAAERFAQPSYRKEAVAIGKAVLVNATVELPDQRPVLVAGSWAREAPFVINPSYFAPRAFAELAAATGDRRWAQLRDSSHQLTQRLATDPPRLPPDWAEVDSSGTPRAIASPGNPAGEPRYGFDAARLLVRYASDCGESSRRLVASAGSRLPSATDQVVAEYNLDGAGLVDFEHPLGMVAAAAYSYTTGDRQTARQRLDQAEQLDARSPTYYGAAWVALGRLMLTTNLLGPCAPDAPRDGNAPLRQLWPRSDRTRTGSG
jgi:endoglucanase